MDQQKPKLSPTEIAAIQKAGERALAAVVDRPVLDRLLRAPMESLILAVWRAAVAQVMAARPGARSHGHAPLAQVSMADDRPAPAAYGGYLSVRQVARLHSRLIMMPRYVRP